jgi:predicted RNA-binding protein associated with RNAse of E/G family
VSRIEIRYRRPPDRLDVFFQDLVVDGSDFKITLHDPSTLETTLSVGDRVIYEPGAPILWFVFPDAWYDIGRFHLKDGTFTGYYVNLILPPDLSERAWEMYDLCLDIWIDPHGSYQVLDQDEFDEAVDNRWIDPATACRARKELQRIIDELDAGRFPPPPVNEHDLPRARALRAQSHQTRRTPLR